MRPFRKKKTVDPEKAGNPQSVRDAAVVLLARRDFSSGELSEKLRSQGYERDVVAETVAELAAGGLIDDARYAEHYVAYHADRGQGPVRIAGDLKSMGLAPELIDAAIESGPDWRALAREVRIRKFGLEVPATWPDKGRQARFLQYRGFSSDHIRSALGPDFNPDD